MKGRPNGKSRDAMTYEQCAEFLGVSVSTVKRLKKSGLPFVDEGGVRFIKSSVLDWMRQREKRNESASAN